jgi:hypothetical protein
MSEYIIYDIYYHKDAEILSVSYNNKLDYVNTMSFSEIRDKELIHLIVCKLYATIAQFYYTNLDIEKEFGIKPLMRNISIEDRLVFIKYIYLYGSEFITYDMNYLMISILKYGYIKNYSKETFKIIENDIENILRIIHKKYKPIYDLLVDDSKFIRETSRKIINKDEINK